MDSENKNLLIILGEWWAKKSSHQAKIAKHYSSKWLPSPGNILFTLLAIILLVATQATWAQNGPSPASVSTNTISYQGRLADTSGTPITGLQNIEFRLYDVPVGGTPLWEEFWTGSNSVQVSDGLFNVMLGSLNTELTNVVSGKNQLYLGITIGTDSEMYPRVQLGSVPFSMKALTVPDGSINTEQIADGAVTLDKLGSDIELTPPDGSVTNSKIALTRFGIGTSVPDHTPVTSSYLTLGEANYSLAYDASLLISLNYTGYGGRVIARVINTTTGQSLCGLNHNNSTTAIASRVCIADVPAGEHTFEFQVRSASSSGSPHVRSESSVLIVPLAQP